MRPSEINARRKIRFGQATLLRITFEEVWARHTENGFVPFKRWYFKIPAHLAIPEATGYPAAYPDLTFGPYRSREVAVEQALIKAGVIPEGEG